MVKVSLVIPVYKAAAHIAACLDAVLAQTLDEIEAILVDDCSPDGSIAAARAHLAAYTGPKRFVFARTPANGGPGAARNLGIGLAQGDYVAFLDSDDSIAPDFCRALYEAAVHADADLAFCHIAFDYPDGRIRIRRNPAASDGAFEGKAKRSYLRRFKSYFTTYLYRRRMLAEEGIGFPGTRSAEDSCFLICSLLSARRIASVDRVLYRYRIGDASISRRRDPARWKNRIASFRALKAFARRKGFYSGYRHVLRLVICKKGWLMALRDYLSNNLF